MSLNLIFIGKIDALEKEYLRTGKAAREIGCIKVCVAQNNNWVCAKSY